MKHRRILLLLIALLLLLPLTSCVLPYEPVSLDPDGLFVLFMDVGQADCALILQGEDVYKRQLESSVTPSRIP